jgi:Fe-S-cluster containining protein
MPTFYQCERCTACCRWPGQVRITEAEITAMAGHLKMDETSFIERFTRLRPDRKGLSLLDKENGECVFLDGTSCRVQAAKPQQCRDFPNLWRFPGFESKCHANPVEIQDEEEYRRQIMEATGRQQINLL